MLRAVAYDIIIAMYKVEVKHEKDLLFSVRSSNYEFVIDAKAKDGITPPDTLLAALASCVGGCILENILKAVILDWRILRF